MSNPKLQLVSAAAEARPRSNSDAASQPADPRLGLKLSIWAACLAVGSAVSILIFGADADASGSFTRVAFYAATSAAYLAAFCHCLMRLVYSRWPSWFLFTLGFGALTVAGLLGMSEYMGFVVRHNLVERIELLKTATIPVAATILLCAAHAARARSATALRRRPWVVYARVFFITGLLVVAWYYGAFGILSQIVSASNPKLRLAVDLLSAAALLALFNRTRRLATGSRDEVVVPIAYWSLATSLGIILRVVTWTTPDLLWRQAMGLEVVAIAALFIGLSLENERAHRESVQEMADLQAMKQISWSLVGASDESELSNALARAISDGFGARAVAVYLHGHKDDELIISGVIGVDDELIKVGKPCSLAPQRRPGFHNGHTARAFASGSSQMVGEIFSDVEFIPWRMVAQEEGVVASVPLPYEDRVIGVINLFVAGVKSIAQNRMRLIEAVAASVSPAIVNARLKEMGRGELRDAI